MIKGPLVFDIGMHLGEDTAFYRQRGFKVVGVEANPALIPRLQERFSADLSAGHVFVVEAAIGPRAGETSFAVVNGATLWGTVDQGFIRRAEQSNLKIDRAPVKVVSLKELIQMYGAPYYIKIDIEGMDLACVSGLWETDVRPQYLSIESVSTGPNAGWRAVFDELFLMKRLGYRRFKLVDQGSLRGLDGCILSGEGPPLVYRWEQDASGPFGKDVAGPWRTIGPTLLTNLAVMSRHQVIGFGGSVARSRWGQHLRRQARRTLDAATPGFHLRNRWYDLHVTL